MSNQEFQQRRRQDDDAAPGADPAGAAASGAQQHTQGVDDLLDEIDAVLETNAETFVQGFVQKGGQ